ncbi:hypothetical protein M1M07_24795 [Rhodococcus sp. HM1]|uniref:hypothetical protein n=1 Tax=unclassified Rhodococcus (in: high G+C Gram-positive bacteria) TaxID=192944 RepID=UPI0018CEBB94|nr:MULTISPECIES: hypothetical protein [unclassified Rhodococcus (in: high G+C Gram-positive bacteria)]MBH0123681.1 hypothetical protein [Rhodococcus sp. CX]MCK8674317.1 hypothetical protein [Rhodococcus sp. HM1]
MNALRTLSDITTWSGIDVFDHLDREVSVPVVDGPQAQGDLIVVPHTMLAGVVTRHPWTRTVPVPASGIELLRSAAGGNPHSLVADEDACTWTAPVTDPRGLALGIVEVTGVAYLVHPEHGATGIAPGRYVIGRQRERGTGLYGAARLVAD